MTNPYAASGVDTEAGDRAVELMKQAVSSTHNNLVLGSFGGFAGMIDASILKSYDHPILATSTDGVGTKVAIAQAMDKHDTIGQDLVGMVVDDIVVTGARSLFMTDYIACGLLEPTRIADIVRGIAKACKAVDVALVGGETAEHPGLLKPHEYDVAGAAVGVVEKDKILSSEKVQVGDVVLGLQSSGLHSNGYSLVRKIVADNNWQYTDLIAEFGRTLGEELLEPTALYTGVLNKLLQDIRYQNKFSTMSHITGGGIAANLSRVLPAHVSLDVQRSTWRPQPVFQVLAESAGIDLFDLESTWNLGLGFAIVVREDSAASIIGSLRELGVSSWQLGVIEPKPENAESKGYLSSAKGTHGGSVRLVGEYAK
ncbi:MAG: phosphoribosylformylglycinamidine cyclo-ligase [Aquiluna sp.]|jgi:phosphoribosylformylglycinamidine cyclo-ligase